MGWDLFGTHKLRYRRVYVCGSCGTCCAGDASEKLRVQDWCGWCGEAPRTLCRDHGIADGTQEQYLLLLLLLLLHVQAVGEHQDVRLFYLVHLLPSGSAYGC